MDRCRYLLKKNRVELVTNIVLTGLWDHLIAAGIVNNTGRETLEYNKTRTQQVGALLDHVGRRNEETFGRFCQCLRDTDQSHIVDYYLTFKEGDNLIPPSCVETDNDHYYRRLVDFHKKRTLQQIKSDFDYVPTIIYIGKDKLEDQANRKHFKELIMPQKRQIQMKIDQSNLFKLCEELEEADNPRTVLLIGVPGIGKTTLCFKLLHDVILDKLHLGDGPTIPYLIKFRETNLIKRKITFRELLFCHSGPTVEDDEESGVWQYLKAHEKSILFILDGCDECQGIGINFDEKYTQQFSAVDKEAEPQVLLYNLMEGFIMPQSRVFVTTRPFCIDSIKSCANRVVELDGFYDAEIQELTRKALGPERQKLQESFIAYLNDYPHMAGLCFVPRQATCLISYMKEEHKDPQITTIDVEKMPKSVAGLLIRVTLFLLKESIKDKKRLNYSMVAKMRSKTLMKLVELAFNGLCSDTGVQQIFTEEDIEKLQLSEEDIGSGILSGYEIAGDSSLFPGEMCFLYSFPHLTIQELFANFKLWEMPTAELQSLIKQVTGEHTMMWLLFFGVGGDCSIKQLISHMFPRINQKESDKRTFHVLQTLFDSLQERHHDELFLLHALNESKQWAVADLLVPTLVDWKGTWIMQHITPADYTAIGHYLSHISKPIDAIGYEYVSTTSALKVMLTGPAMNGYTGLIVWMDISEEMLSVIRMVTAAHRYLHHLALGHIHNTIDQSSLFVSKPIDSLQQLSLSVDNISPEWLHDNIINIPQLEVFTLSRCSQTESNQWNQVLHQLQFLSKLQYLNLWDLDFNDEVVDEVCQIVKMLPIKWLYLVQNNISNDGLEALVQGIKSTGSQLEALHIQDLSYTSQGLQNLCDALRDNPVMKILAIDVMEMTSVSKLLQKNTGIQELVIKCKDFGCANYLQLRGNSNLTYLHLQGALSDDNMRHLVNILEDNNTLLCLRLSPFLISDAHFQSVDVIVDMINRTNLEAIILDGMEIAENDCCRVAEAVSSNNKLTTVYLSNREKFLLELADHYPAKGPLKGVYVFPEDMNAFRPFARKLKEKITTTQFDVYFNVKNIALHAGYSWKSIPTHIKSRLYSDISIER